MDTDRNVSPRAIVIGLELNGLGVVRSLAEGGVKVVGLDTDSRRAPAWTRYADVKPIRSFEGPELVEDLLALPSLKQERPVLFPTKEVTVATLSSARDILCKHFRFVLPSADMLATLTDKRGFQDTAEAWSFPVPKAVTLKGLEDLEKVTGLSFPCVLKPDRHVPSYQAHFKKAYRLEDFEQLARLYRDIHPVYPNMIVQEWIEGDDGEIYFCLQYRNASNEKLASFTGRKIRSFPPQTGGTASCTAAPEAAGVLEDLTDRFFARSRCVGMASMEFKRDRRSGQFHLVEPTVGRTDHQSEIATLNGVNLPLTAYADLCGLPLPSVRPVHRPRIWRDPDADAKAAMQGNAEMPRGRVVDAYFRLQDPAPWFALRTARFRSPRTTVR
jgi:D-aspartate ligase